MPLIIYPVQPLAGLAASSEGPRLRITEITAARARQMEDLWQRLATTLGLDANGELDKRQARILAAGGAVIIDRDAPAEEAIWQRLRQESSWVQVFKLQPLPQPAPVLAPVQGPLGAWHLGHIKPPPGFDGTGVVIGVVDTGIDPVMFPELSAVRSVQSVYNIGTKALNAVAAPIELDATGQHGSAVCAMLAGATSGIARGVVLVLASVPDQMVGLHGGTVADAVDWLLRQTQSGPRLGQTAAGGCDIINISRVTSAPGAYDASLYQLMLDARDVYKTLVVAAVGNSGGLNKWQCPGAYDCVLSVGAVTKNNVVFGSAWGTPTGGAARPDMVAPGRGLNQPKTSGSITRSGTSFASPLVAGAAALALQKNPLLIGNPVAIKNRLTSLARGPADVQRGAGVLDLTNL